MPAATLPNPRWQAGAIDHVTVEQARGGGLGLYGQSGLQGPSTELTVRNSGYVARIPAREAARFPLGGRFRSQRYQ